MAKKKIRILQAIYCLGRGGAEKLAIDITRELATRANVEVLLVSFDKTVDFEYSTDDINYKFCPAAVSLSPVRANRYALDNYMSLVKDFQPDIIHSHRYLSEIITRSYLVENAKYFTHCHDNMTQFRAASPATFFNKQLLSNYYERVYLLSRYKKCNNQFIAISDDTLSYFRNNLPPALGSRVHLLLNAIDYNRFNAASHPRNSSPIRLVNTGNFNPKKNQIFLVEIMNNLKQRGVMASLTLLGKGVDMERVKDKVNLYGLDDRVNFAGSVEDITPYLHGANMYIHSAYYEPFGLVLLEGMAAGLPVISLDGRGNRGLIRDGENGFFITEQNANLFADKIMLLANNESLYEQMSRQAVEFARGFDIKKYVDRLLEIYVAP